MVAYPHQAPSGPEFRNLGPPGLAQVTPAVRLTKAGTPDRRGLARKGRPPDPANVRRAERMVVAYVRDDMTLEEIARYHGGGITRERVRQILNKTDRTLYRLAIRRRQARTRMRSVGSGHVSGGMGFYPRDCPTCGLAFTAENAMTMYCTPTHRQVALLLRYHTDDSVRTRHREAIARHGVANGVGSQIFHDHVLNDPKAIVSKGRWLLPGSMTWHWAVRALALGWPIFEKLPPEIQAQIREAYDG